MNEFEFLYLTLQKLGLDIDSIKTKKELFPAAASIQGELRRNPKLKLGMIRDCVYFIFFNDIIQKIGKVGGGNRCLHKRILDYRSSDPTGIAIKEAISKNMVVNIVALEFKFEKQIEFGVEIEGVVRGPMLEKELIKRAAKLGMNLPLNKNKG
tara:strand:- start:52 stop:510 length:459 start_codon:yes stop_codon:yes gene_type:complete